MLITCPFGLWSKKMSHILSLIRLQFDFAPLWLDIYWHCRIIITRGPPSSPWNVSMYLPRGLLQFVPLLSPVDLTVFLSPLPLFTPGLRFCCSLLVVFLLFLLSAACRHRDSLSSSELRWGGQVSCG